MPASTARQAIGSAMVKNTRAGEAPSERATFSRRSGTAAKPSRAAPTRNGSETNAIATMIPASSPTNSSPTGRAAFCRSEWRPIMVSSAMPAAECGTMIGKSTSPCTKACPTKRPRASR